MAEIEDLERKRDAEKGGRMKELEDCVSRKKKEEAKAQSDVTHARETIAAEKKKLKDAEKSSKQVRKKF